MGEGSRSGDAIALRYGNLSGKREEQNVVVIDGGTLESGVKLVELIKTAYNTSVVDFVVSTHPDADHASGLEVVLEELRVRQLLMHKPWDHAESIHSLFVDGRITAPGLEEKIRRALEDAHDLEAIANRKGIPIREPFAGLETTDNALLVLGPDREYYQSLLADFRCTPEPAKKSSLASTVAGAVREAITWVKETLHLETLDDSGQTSAENNSSVILLLRVDGRSLLFTGDAGIPALTRAADYALSRNIDLSQLTLLQVPHHGSRHNVGPTILNRIKGSSAYISVCAEGEPKHPSKKVINALIRRGASVFQTKGKPLVYCHDVPFRPGYVNATKVPFSELVEE